jgi:hypothetical protein
VCYTKDVIIARQARKVAWAQSELGFNGAPPPRPPAPASLAPSRRNGLRFGMHPFWVLPHRSLARAPPSGRQRGPRRAAAMEAACGVYKPGDGNAKYPSIYGEAKVTVPKEVKSFVHRPVYSLRGSLYTTNRRAGKIPQRPWLPRSPTRCRR